MNYEFCWNEFLKKLRKGKIKLLARPNEELHIHIKNMLIEMKNYFLSMPRFSEPYGFLIYFGTFISILSHDLGKISPFFQYNLQKGENCPKIPNYEKKYTYHTLSSIIFSLLFILNLEDYIKLNNNKNISCSKSEILHIIIGIVWEGIYCHHSPCLRNLKLNFLDIDLQNDKEYLRFIIKYMRKIDKSILNTLFDEISLVSAEILNSNVYNIYFEEKEINFKNVKNWIVNSFNAILNGEQESFSNITNMDFIQKLV
ncbi:MAG: hypothetical protein ACTSXP_13830, partial [Promethearchaeota archaeon]